ncbi:MAG: flavin reductase family protein [Anaerolineae bacterium]|nr:flavin reductase family protein [Anaerolineae bacterium]
MRSIDPKALDRPNLYNLMTSAVAPRPIAWVSTINTDGMRNIAAFSYFNAMSTMPPLLVISVGMLAGGRVKDTLLNVQAVPEFVVHIASGDLMAQVELTGLEFPHDVDEFAEAGLTPVPSEVVRPPRIAEAPVALECVLHEIHPLPAGSKNTLVIGEVVRFHVREDLLGDHHLVNTLALDPISRLARKDFALLGRVADGQTLLNKFRAKQAGD